MNVNVNLNLNNAINQVSNNAMHIASNKHAKNKQGLEIENSFLNMLLNMNVISSTTNTPDLKQLSSLNNMGIFNEYNLVSPMDSSNIDILGKEEDIQEKDNMLESFMKMQNIFNFGAPIFSTQFEADNSLGINDSKTTENQRIFENLNVEAKPDSNINIEVKPDLNINVEAKDNFKANIFAEKLITEIEKNRESLKEKIDLNVGALSMDKSPLVGQSKIIISDESNELKPQIMSQVKDMIVFTAEQGPEPGSTIKNVTMELTPASLGKVEIKMSFRNNKVTVEIKALNEEAQKIIASSVDELASILGKTSEAVQIVVKSPSPLYEHQLYTYNQGNSEANYEQFNGNNQDNGHGRQKDNYYENEDNNNSNKEEEDTFSKLINLRTRINT